MMGHVSPDKDRPRSERPRGWLVGAVVVLFLYEVFSIFGSALESQFHEVAWFQLHVMAVFGAYLAWITLLVPASIAMNHFKVNLLPDGLGERAAGILLFALTAVWLAWRGHGLGFIAQSELGGALAVATTVYWRAVVWHAQQRWLRWLT